MGESVKIGLIEFQETRQHGLEEGQCCCRFQGRTLQIEKTTPTKTGPEQGWDGLAVELTQMQRQRLQRQRGSVEQRRVILAEQPQAILEAALIQALGALCVHPDLVWIMTTHLLEPRYDEGVRIARHTLYGLEQQARIVRSRFPERLGQLHAGCQGRFGEPQIRLPQGGWQA